MPMIVLSFNPRAREKRDVNWRGHARIYASTLGELCEDECTMTSEVTTVTKSPTAEMLKRQMHGSKRIYLMYNQ